MQYIAIVAISIVGLSVCIGAAACYGTFLWQAETKMLRAQLEEARVLPRSRIVDLDELESLPMPVQRYLRAALRDGQPLVTTVRMEQAGTFNMGERNERWKPFTATQLVVTRGPGFDWYARIAMAPGLSVRVHDAYATGEGILHASLFGLMTLADMRGTHQMAEGELMRFLAEAVWYPTALLPSQGVHWMAVDDTSATATLQDGDVTVTLLFRFNQAGLVESVYAEDRGRAENGTMVPTPWEGHFAEYEIRNGMLVPAKGEVAWILPDGPKPYWRGRITDSHYEVAR